MNELQNIFDQIKNYGYVYDKHNKYKPGDVAQWQDGLHRKRADGKWEKIGDNELPENYNRDKMDVRVSSDIKDGKSYKQTLVTAKSTQKAKDAWRVDTDFHGAKDYLNKVLIQTKGGSCACVTKDGDIISLCKNKNDLDYRGRDVLNEAIKNGGLKLDSFEGNFNFYTKNGFEPVSWCEFDENYAPSGWVKGRDDKEPIIFFKYVGLNKVKYRQIENFYKDVTSSQNYDNAQAIRDKGVHHAHTRGI